MTRGLHRRRDRPDRSTSAYGDVAGALDDAGVTANDYPEGLGVTTDLMAAAEDGTVAFEAAKIPLLTTVESDRPDQAEGERETRERLAQILAEPADPRQLHHGADEPAARARSDALEVDCHVAAAIGAARHAVVDDRARTEVR